MIKSSVLQYLQILYMMLANSVKLQVIIQHISFKILELIDRSISEIGFCLVQQVFQPYALI